jgi:hypothetical protein
MSAPCNDHLSGIREKLSHLLLALYWHRRIIPAGDDQGGVLDLM